MRPDADQRLRRHVVRFLIAVQRGSCTRSATVPGPDGHSASRDETVTRTGRGDFSTSGRVTGPNGRTVSNQGQTDCGRYACARTGTITGRNGGSASTSGWWWQLAETKTGEPEGPPATFVRRGLT